MTVSSKDRLAFALDVGTLDDARHWINLLGGHVGVFKVGLELFTAAGPAAIQLVHDAGCACFLDLKLHDIPATMAKGVRSANGLGVAYLTVHASAGSEALAECAAATGNNTRLLAVTVLTSHDAASLKEIGFGHAPEEAVPQLATLAINAGIRGFVTSAKECAALCAIAPEDATLVVPGIRPLGSAADDQRRIATPADAIAAGASLLVVGRPIRNATDPVLAADAIVNEIERARSA